MHCPRESATSSKRHLDRFNRFKGLTRVTNTQTETVLVDYYLNVTCHNYTSSSTKPEVYSIPECCQRRTMARVVSQISKKTICYSYNKANVTVTFTVRGLLTKSNKITFLLLHPDEHAWRYNSSDSTGVPDRPDVKIKNHGLGQHGAQPHYSTLPFWQLCALTGLKCDRSCNKVSRGEAICSPPMAVGPLRGHTVQPHSECVRSDAGDGTDIHGQTEKSQHFFMLSYTTACNFEMLLASLHVGQRTSSSCNIAF